MKESAFEPSPATPLLLYLGRNQDMNNNKDARGDMHVSSVKKPNAWFQMTGIQTL